MKKLISTVLLFAMALSLLAGCTIVPADPAENLDDARKYVISYFQGSSETTDVDYTVIGSVLVNEVKYTIAWTTDNENVKIVPQEDGFVLIDVPELTSEKVYYTLTATITAPSGATADYSITRKISAAAGVGKTDEDIVKEAYALEKGAEMEGTATLTGVISRIKTPYDTSFSNITVILIVGDLKDMPIECYRMKGDGADTLAPGDTITVQGVLKNYNGTIEFDAGCALTKTVKGPEVTCPATAAEVIAAAKALESGWSLPYMATMTGVVTEITSAYDAKYMNLSVKITVGDENFECYRLVGEDGANIAVGDTITVTGYMMNWKGSVQFGQGCTLDVLVPHPCTEYAPATCTKPESCPVCDRAKEGSEALGHLDENLDHTCDRTDCAEQVGEHADGDDEDVLCDYCNKEITQIGSVQLTVDSLGLTSNSYTAGTATVGGVGFEWIQLGNYGDGIQVRDKDGKTSTFWNTIAFSAPIVKIELVYSSTKDLTNSNANCEIFYFGNAVDNYTYSTKLSTTAGTTVYTIIPDTQTYTFMKFEHDLGYSMYWASITIYFAGSNAEVTPSICAHTGGTATCTEKAVCELCGEVYGNTADHNYVDGSCSACGAEQPVAPAAPFADGDKVVIVCRAHNKALSSVATGYYLSGVDVTVADGTVTGYADTEVWTVIANADGSYSFAYNGQNLSMQESYASISLGAVNDDWTLVPQGNGTFALQNTVRGNYIEWYSDKGNWSSYNPSTLSELFYLDFYVVG